MNRFKDFSLEELMVMISSFRDLRSKSERTQETWIDKEIISILEELDKEAVEVALENMGYKE